MAEELEKIEKISRLERSKGLEGAANAEPVERVAPNKEHFESLLNSQQATSVQSVEIAEQARKDSGWIQKISEVNHQIESFGKKSPEEIVAQTKDVIAQIDDIKQKLRTPDLKIDPTVQSLMDSKLSHIDEKLKVAADRAGVDYTTLETREARSSLRNPIERFLGYLENGEGQLKGIAREVAALGENNQSISPAKLLLIQVKVGFVQQELEFFSNLLNQSLSSAKTLMNVQV